MTNLDIGVFIFGVLVSGLVGAGFLLMVYGRAFSEQSMRESVELNSGIPRVGKFLADAAEPTNA